MESGLFMNVNLVIVKEGGNVVGQTD